MIEVGETLHVIIGTSMLSFAAFLIAFQWIDISKEEEKND